MECFRRLLLASVIGVASRDSALAPVLGFLLCLLFLHLFSKRPFKKRDNSTLGIVLTYSLAFIFLGALLIKVNAQPNGELERRIFEIVLVFLLLVGPGLILFNILWSFCMKRVKCRKKQAVISRRPKDNPKRVKLFRPRRRASFVMFQDNPIMNSWSPRNGVDSNAETVDAGSQESNLHIILLDPSTLLSEQISLRAFRACSNAPALSRMRLSLVR